MKVNSRTMTNMVKEPISIQMAQNTSVPGNMI